MTCKRPSTPTAQSTWQTLPRTRLLTPAQPQPPTNLRAHPPRVNSVHDIRELAERLRDFAVARDWEQFHTPKNLAMALAGEAGELLAEFQWLTPEEAAAIMADPQAARQVRSEIADVFLYLTRLADVLGVDLLGSAADKLEENERRYDAATYRGSRRKAPALSKMNPLSER
jgi:NTP pyrophosphatase (non-canonical NTP hydrolase)